MNDFAIWAERLENLGNAVRRRLQSAAAEVDDFALPVAQEGGDTIFAIDRHVESIIEAEIDAWPAECKPLLLVAEGFGADGRRHFGTSGPCLFRVLADPIDGTRGLMYDKRSAWFLASVALDHGDATRLSDTFASTLVELPTSKQSWCDSYTATATTPTRGKRQRVDGSDRCELPVRPSAACSLAHGFGQVVNFFPGVKELAANLMERIAAETLGDEAGGQALIFDDQYISTGGQMAELIAGHDRFTCDLRPLFYAIHQKRTGIPGLGLECHPYDIAAALVAQQAGVILTDGYGEPLDSPFDVTTGIHWCGYANETIRGQVQPIVTRWLKEQDM